MDYNDVPTFDPMPQLTQSLPPPSSDSGSPASQANQQNVETRYEMPVINSEQQIIMPLTPALGM